MHLRDVVSLALAIKGCGFQWSSQEMKIASFNINNVRHRLPVCGVWVCFNEAANRLNRHRVPVVPGSWLLCRQSGSVSQLIALCSDFFGSSKQFDHAFALLPFLGAESKDAANPFCLLGD
jgi:hypothetical protein